MNLTISGHHLEVTPALREYVLTKLDRVTRHFDQVVDVTVLLTVEKLKEWRSYFIVGAFVVAAVVTPPDVVSQLALAIPMCILYELGIVAARIFAKHTQASEPEEAEKA